MSDKIIIRKLQSSLISGSELYRDEIYQYFQDGINILPKNINIYKVFDLELYSTSRNMCIDGNPLFKLEGTLDDWSYSYQSIGINLDLLAKDFLFERKRAANLFYLIYGGMDYLKKKKDIVKIVFPNALLIKGVYDEPDILVNKEFN